MRSGNDASMDYRARNVGSDLLIFLLTASLLLAAFAMGGRTGPGTSATILASHTVADASRPDDLRR